MVSVPSVEDEDLRHLGRELKLLKKDRTRISNRIKGLLANHGRVLASRKEMGRQIVTLKSWDGSELPRLLKGRLLRYAADYEHCSERIRVVDEERKALLRSEAPSVCAAKVLRLTRLKGVGIETAWCENIRWPGSHRSVSSHFRRGAALG